MLRRLSDETLYKTITSFLGTAFLVGLLAMVLLPLFGILYLAVLVASFIL